MFTSHEFDVSQPVQMHPSEHFSVLKEVASEKIESNRRVDQFSRPVFAKMHQVGCLWTKPLSLAVKWMHKTTYNTETKRVVRLFEMIGKGFVLAMACVPAIVGAAFRGIASLGRNSFAYSPKTEDLVLLQSAKSQTSAGLKIMTWNTGLGPGFMAVSNELEHPENRVAAIAGQIQHSGADVVALQEVFDKDASDALVKELNDRGYDCIHAALSDDFAKLPSGLMIAVKREKRNQVTLEVEEVKAWKFTNLAGEDALSNKGLLGVKLKISKEERQESFYIFDTHLQASYGERGYSQVRREQITSIAERIQEWTLDSKNVVLCGDLNFGSHPLESGDDPNEYDEQMQTLERHGLKNMHVNVDLSETESDGSEEMSLSSSTSSQPSAHSVEKQDSPRSPLKGTFVDVKKKSAEGHRIYELGQSIVDYVFVSSELAKKGIKLAKIIDIRNSSSEWPVESIASDHLPVVYEVGLSVLSSGKKTKKPEPLSL